MITHLDYSKWILSIILDVNVTESGNMKDNHFSIFQFSLKFNIQLKHIETLADRDFH